MSDQILVILAGGAGTRLKSVEAKPKPLTDIAGKQLVLRIIEQFDYLDIFSRFVLMTCGDVELFQMAIPESLQDKVCILNQRRREGRLSAVRHFISRFSSVDTFFICNGDTLFGGLRIERIRTALSHHNHYDPLVFLGSPDNSRSDYRVIKDKDGNPMQNSGLVYLSREWVYSNTGSGTDDTPRDIDTLIFDSGNRYMTESLETTVYDVGTPDRLQVARLLFS